MPDAFTRLHSPSDALQTAVKTGVKTPFRRLQTPFRRGAFTPPIPPTGKGTPLGGVPPPKKRAENGARTAPPHPVLQHLNLAKE
jgi:hypothetical protein